MRIAKIIIFSVILIFTCAKSHAQSYPNLENSSFGTEETKKSAKTPQANFFEGKKSNSDFFADKSITPNLSNTNKISTYNQTPTITSPESNIQVSSPPNSDQPANESWSAEKPQNSDTTETQEVKDFDESLQKVSEQNIEDPKIKDVIEQSKKIKEALFGKAEEKLEANAKKPPSSTKHEKVTKEIERF